MVRNWGYTDDNGRVHFSPQNGGVTGLLTWGIEGGDERFNEHAAVKTDAVLVPVENLAVELFTTTGMRMTEAMHVRLDPDCFICLEMPAPTTRGPGCAGFSG